jgi:hypothetical protein
MMLEFDFGTYSQSDPIIIIFMKIKECDLKKRRDRNNKK